MKYSYTPIADQRQTILDSDLFKSGNTFTRVDAAKILGASDASARQLLRQMAEDGLIEVVPASKYTAGRSLTRYKRTPPKLLRMAWRKISNESLGVVAPL